MEMISSGCKKLNHIIAYDDLKEPLRIKNFVYLSELGATARFMASKIPRNYFFVLLVGNACKQYTIVIIKSINKRFHA